MKTNVVPHYDESVNTTGCCPKFNPEGWDNQELHFKEKSFVRAATKSLLHIPLNMDQVFSRVQKNITEANAHDPDNFIVLSHDLSASNAEHLFAVAAPVPEERNDTLTGNFITKVFEGPYRKVKVWEKEMKRLVTARGTEPGDIYFFYTTCPKCAKAYGKNYILGVAQI